MSEAYRMYEANKLLVSSDPTLTDAPKTAEITRLTHELEEEEARQGIVWHPIASVNVTNATTDGSAMLIDTTEKKNERKDKKS